MKKHTVLAPAMLVCALLSSGLDSRASIIVVPGYLEAAEGPTNDTSPLGLDGEVRFQQVYASSILSALSAGDVITGLTFRVKGGPLTSVPAQVVTNYEIRLSTSVNAPGSLSLTFADNRGADEVIARTGQLVIGAGDFPAGADPGPNPLGIIIPFVNSFTYMGGNLLLEVAYTGFANGRHADNDNLLSSGQQIFTFGGAGKFSATTADYTENGAFVTGLQVDQSAVPEPASVLTVLGGLGLIVVKLRRVG